MIFFNDLVYRLKRACLRVRPLFIIDVFSSCWTNRGTLTWQKRSWSRLSRPCPPSLRFVSLNLFEIRLSPTELTGALSHRRTSIYGKPSRKAKWLSTTSMTSRPTMNEWSANAFDASTSTSSSKFSPCGTTILQGNSPDRPQVVASSYWFSSHIGNNISFLFCRLQGPNTNSQSSLWFSR